MTSALDLPRFIEATVDAVITELPGDTTDRLQKEVANRITTGIATSTVIPEFLTGYLAAQACESANLILRSRVQQLQIQAEQARREAEIRQRMEAARLPKQLADGTLGWHVRRTDECLAAAVATVLQIPLDEVPDARIDERLAGGESADQIERSACGEMERWLAGRGLRMVVHRRVPARRRRWIGVVPMPGEFNAHCLVMCGPSLLFDPAVSVEYAVGLPERRVRTWRPDEIAWGLSFRALT